MSGKMDARRKLRRTMVIDGALSARSVSVISCDCDPHSVWVRFHNQDGEIFAVACLPVASAQMLAEDVRICAQRPGVIGSGSHSGVLH